MLLNPFSKKTYGIWKWRNIVQCWLHNELENTKGWIKSTFWHVERMDFFCMIWRLLISIYSTVYVHMQSQQAVLISTLLWPEWNMTMLSHNIQWKISPSCLSNTIICALLWRLPIVSSTFPTTLPWWMNTTSVFWLISHIKCPAIW